MIKSYLSLDKHICQKLILVRENFDRFEFNCNYIDSIAQVLTTIVTNQVAKWTKEGYQTSEEVGCEKYSCINDGWTTISCNSTCKWKRKFFTFKTQ
jgi:hypothetical protein